MMNFVLYRVSNFFTRAFDKLARVSEGLSQKMVPKDIQHRLITRSTEYDMVRSPNESYYAEQYWRVMSPHFDQLPKNPSILDLGCGQGRFAIPLGEKFGAAKILACDISKTALAQAEEYAKASSVQNIEFRNQSVSECLAGIPSASVDAILMTEVTFFYPDWKTDFSKITDVLKPGGFLFIGFRPQLYHALDVVRKKRLDIAKSLLERREGPIFETFPLFTWYTSGEIKDFFGQSKITLLELTGIGTCSGIPGDPQDYISQPSHLSEKEKTQLMELELEMGKTLPDAGRYMLAIGKKQ